MIRREDFTVKKGEPAKKIVKKENYTFFGKGGNSVDEPEAFAKLVSYEKFDMYFVWFWKGDLYDPYGMDILRRSQNMLAKYVKVTRPVFESYIKYLKTKNKAFYTSARREHQK
jgi:hypothetical protein